MATYYAKLRRKIKDPLTNSVWYRVEADTMANASIAAVKRIEPRLPKIMCVGEAEVMVRESLTTPCLIHCFTLCWDTHQNKPNN